MKTIKSPKKKKTKKRKPRTAAAAAADIMLEAMIDGVAVADFQNRLIQGNKALVELLGYDSVDEMLGMNTADLVPKREISRIMEAGKKCIKKGSLKSFETVALRKDGEEVPVWLNATALKDASGKFIGIMSVMKDITELRRAEANIRQQNEFLNSVLESLTHPFYVIDGNDYTVKMANTAANIGDLSKKIKCYKATHRKNKPCGGKGHLCPLKKVKKTKKPVTVEHIHYDKDGAVRNINVHAFPIFDHKGKVVQMIECNFDITEQKKAEEKLKESEEKYRTLYETIRDGIAGGPMDGRITECNQAFVDMLGYSKEELGNLTYQQLTPKQWYQMEAEIIEEQILKRGYSDEYEKEYIRKDGTVFPVSARVWLIRDGDGKPKGMWGIVRDITERKKAEEELIRLSSAVKMSVDSIVISDLNGKIIDVNEATLKMYDTKNKRDLIGKNSFDLIVPEEREKALAGAKQALEKGYVENREYHIITKGGDRILVEMNIAVMKDQDGKPIGFVGVSRDITERKKREEEIKTEKKKLETYIDSMADGVVILDTKGKVINVNKSYTKMFGREKNEVMGKLSFTVGDIPKREIPKALLILKEIIKKDLVKNRELTLLTKEKKEIPILFSANLIRDTAGNPMSIFAVFKDITERKKAERALLEQKEKLQKYFDVAGVITVILSPEGGVLLMNKTGSDILGYKGREIIGKDWFTTFIPEKNRAEIRDIFERFISDRIKEFGYFECSVLTKSGEEKIISWHNVVLKDETGKIQAFLNVGADITELKQARVTIQQLRELDEMKDNFLNIAAHELRTPLTSIIGLSELIKEQKFSLDSEYKRYIDIIYGEGIRLTHIIKRMLTVTRFESGRGTIYIEPFDLATFVSSLLPNFRVLSEKTKSKIIIKIEKKNIVINSDKEKISQVIYNFVDNAIKYGPENQTITISVTEPKRNWVKIEVIDQGKGIPKDLQKRLFTKFSQLEPSLTRSQEGTGLGLYICKLIVGMLGGKIGVKSTLGKGSTFYFTLPVKPIKEISTPRKIKPTSF